MVCNVCFFWSAVWASGDSSLRCPYCCNIKPLAHGQNITPVQTKHALIAVGSLPVILFIAVELHLYKQVTYGKKIHIFAVSSNVTGHVLTASSPSPACTV